MIKNKDIHAVLLRMVDLLHVGGVAGWATALEKVANEVLINPSAASAKILSMYGGMGSLNDIILYKDGQPLTLENAELNELREKLYQLCRE